jgi:hypothetical protein
MEHKHYEDNVDGLIFFEKGQWVMKIDNPAYKNCVVDMRVYYCPWCGKKLED